MGSQSPIDTPPDHSNNSAQSFLSLSALNHPPEILRQLRAIFGAIDHPVYLVGGAVRDIVYGRSLKDLDFVVPEGAIALTFQVADRLGVPAYVLDHQRDSGRVVLEGNANYLDITSYRGPNLESDLRDRDFTINAMALPITAINTETLIDPCGGLRDLNRRNITQTHQSAVTSDPVRALRAIRLALELDFNISTETWAAISNAVPMLANSSIERLRDELLKMFGLSRPDEALRLLERSGLLAALLPEIASLKDVRQGAPHHEDVLAHTQSTLRNLISIENILVGADEYSDPRLQRAATLLSGNLLQLAEHLARPVQGGINGRLLLRLSALFHDVGKAETRLDESNDSIRFFDHDQVGSKMTIEAFNRIKMSKQAAKHASRTVAGHMRPLLLAKEPRLTNRAIYRFYRDLGSSGLDCCLHSLADHLAIYHEPSVDRHWEALITVVHRLLDYYFRRIEDSIRPSPLLNGNDLIDLFEIDPGPQIGILLGMLEEAQAIGDIVTREDAVNLVRKTLQ